MIKITSLGNELEEYDKDKSSLSLFIDIDGTKILFDTGKDDEIITNSKKVGVDLSSVDYIVLSSGNINHAGGLKYLDKSKPIVAHPDVFDKNKYGEMGCQVSADDLSNLTLTKEPYELLEGKATFMGEIPRGKEDVNLENGENCVDDSCLAIKSKNGIILILGSARSGVINIVEHVKEKFKDEKITTVVGGLNTLNDQDKLKEILKCFEDNKIVDVYPMYSLCKESFTLLDKFDSKKVNSLETIYVGY